MASSSDALWATALSQPANAWEPHAASGDIYRKPGRRMLSGHGYLQMDDRVEVGRLSLDNYGRDLNGAALGDVPFPDRFVDAQVDFDRRSGRFIPRRDASGEVMLEVTRTAKIAYTLYGDKGPWLVFVHGVPTNRKQWWPVQKRCGSFFRTLSFDLLGMGESSKPLTFSTDRPVPNYDGGEGAYWDERGAQSWPVKGWDWVYDTFYWRKVIQHFCKGEKVILVADDWGSGPNAHFAALHSDMLLGWVQQDPIAFDGYPVSEIQAIGRSHGLDAMPDIQALAWGAFDQTLVQIYKTMVANPNKVYNQYTLRLIKETYADVDYSRLEAREGEDASSLSLRLNNHALRVLAARSSRLAPAQLYPKGPMTPRGVAYSRINVPAMILWGEDDNMMPPNQMYRFQLVLTNAPLVHLHSIANAGHFAATDQPDAVASELINFGIQLLGVGGRASGGLLRTLRSGNLPRGGVAEPFLGFSGLWKGDEKALLVDALSIYAGAGVAYFDELYGATSYVSAAPHASRTETGAAFSAQAEQSSDLFAEVYADGELGVEQQDTDLEKIRQDLLHDKARFDRGEILRSVYEDRRAGLKRRFEASAWFGRQR